MAVAQLDPMEKKRLTFARVIRVAGIVMVSSSALLILLSLIGLAVGQGASLGPDIRSAVIGALTLLLGVWYIRRARRLLRKAKEPGEKA